MVERSPFASQPHSASNHAKYIWSKTMVLASLCAITRDKPSPTSSLLVPGSRCMMN
jgi:hypothetical protein